MIPITKTQVYARSDGKNTIGYAHITLGDSFVVKNIRVVRGKKGIFVGMPSNKTRRGDFVDVFFPISQEARAYLTRTIMEAFKENFPELMNEEKVYGFEKLPQEPQEVID